MESFVKDAFFFCHTRKRFASCYSCEALRLNAVCCHLQLGLYLTSHLTYVFSDVCFQGSRGLGREAKSAEWTICPPSVESIHWMSE